MPGSSTDIAKIAAPEFQSDSLSEYRILLLTDQLLLKRWSQFAPITLEVLWIPRPGSQKSAESG